MQFGRMQQAWRGFIVETQMTPTPDNTLEVGKQLTRSRDIRSEFPIGAIALLEDENDPIMLLQARIDQRTVSAKKFKTLRTFTLCN